MIVYVTSCGSDLDDETARRVDLAQRSIELENEESGGMWVKCDFTPPRTASDLGDGDLPYVRDMVEAGLELCSDGDYVALINSDICVAKEATKRIVYGCSNFKAVYSNRMDFVVRVDHPNASCESISSGRKHIGTDFFAFTKDWWATNGDKFPDMVLGREAWDMVMRRIIKSSGGLEIHNCFYHEWHSSPWEQDRESRPANLHNRALADQWLAVNGGTYYD
jgi:hypothetical protein